MSKPDIANIHFNLKRAVVRESPLDKKLQIVCVELDGTFEDKEQWEVIHEKLVKDGIKIYVSETFQGELVLAANDQLKEVQRERDQFRIERARLTNRVTALEDELAEKRRLLAVLGSDLNE